MEERLYIDSPSVRSPRPSIAGSDIRRMMSPLSTGSDMAEYMFVNIKPSSSIITDEVFRDYCRTRLSEYFDSTSADSKMMDFSSAEVRQIWLKKIHLHFQELGDAAPRLNNKKRGTFHLPALISTDLFIRAGTSIQIDNAVPKVELRAKLPSR